MFLRDSYMFRKVIGAVPDLDHTTPLGIFLMGHVEWLGGIPCKTILWYDAPPQDDFANLAMEMERKYVKAGQEATLESKHVFMNSWANIGRRLFTMNSAEDVRSVATEIQKIACAKEKAVRLHLWQEGFKPFDAFIEVKGSGNVFEGYLTSDVMADRKVEAKRQDAARLLLESMKEGSVIDEWRVKWVAPL